MDSLEQLEKEIEESLPPAIKAFVRKLQDHIEYLEENPPCCGCERVDISYFDDELEAYQAYKDMYESFVEEIKMRIAPEKAKQVSDFSQYLEIRNQKALEVLRYNH